MEQYTEAPDDNVVRIAPEMRRDLRVTTAPAAVRAGGDGVTALGELRVDEDAYAEVGSPIAARVVTVVAGLGNVRRSPASRWWSCRASRLGKARAEYVDCQARARNSPQQALQRKRGLNAERIVPRRELQEAEAEAAAAAAGVRAARAALQALGVSPEARGRAARRQSVRNRVGRHRSSRFVLRAPIAGTVDRAQGGRAARRSTLRDPLFRIADLAHLWLIAQVVRARRVQVQVGAPMRM